MISFATKPNTVYKKKPVVKPDVKPDVQEDNIDKILSMLNENRATIGFLMLFLLLSIITISFFSARVKAKNEENSKTVVNTQQNKLNSGSQIIEKSGSVIAKKSESGSGSGLQVGEKSGSESLNKSGFSKKPESDLLKKSNIFSNPNLGSVIAKKSDLDELFRSNKSDDLKKSGISNKSDDLEVFSEVSEKDFNKMSFFQKFDYFSKKEKIAILEATKDKIKWLKKQNDGYIYDHRDETDNEYWLDVLIPIKDVTKAEIENNGFSFSEQPTEMEGDDYYWSFGICLDNNNYTAVKVIKNNERIEQWINNSPSNKISYQISL